MLRATQNAGEFVSKVSGSEGIALQINAHLERLNEIAMGSPDRKTYATYLYSFENLLDELTRLQTLILKNNPDSKKLNDATLDALANLAAISATYSPFYKLCVLKKDQLLQLANELETTITLLEKILKGPVDSQELEKELAAKLNELMSHRQAIVAAMHKHLADFDESPELANKGLLHNFISVIDATLAPLRSDAKIFKGSEEDLRLKVPADLISGRVRNIPTDDTDFENVMMSVSQILNELKKEKEETVESINFENTFNQYVMRFAQDETNASKQETWGGYLIEVMAAVADLPREVLSYYATRPIQSLNLDESLESELEDDPHDKGKGKEREQDPKTQGRFTDFCNQFFAEKGFEQFFGSPEEVRIHLPQICRGLDETENDPFLFFPPEEMEILHQDKLAEKTYLAEKQRDKNELRPLRKLLALRPIAEKIHEKRNRYLIMTEQLNGTIFETLKKVKPDLSEHIDQIKQDWNNRKTYSYMQSSALKKFADDTTARVNSLSLLFRMIDKKKISKEQLEIITTCEAFIAEQKEKIAQAMLERLKLAVTSGSNFDDVVVATLKSLVDCGLNKSYVDNFTQTPYQSLTNDLILEFNRYISTHGTPAQKFELSKLYVDLKVPLPDNTFVVHDQDLTTSMFFVDSDKQGSNPDMSLTASLFNLDQQFTFLSYPTPVSATDPAVLPEKIEETRQPENSMSASSMFLSADWSMLPTPSLNESGLKESGFGFIHPTEKDLKIREKARLYFGNLITQFNFTVVAKQELNKEADNYEQAFQVAYSTVADELIQKQAAHLFSGEENLFFQEQYIIYAKKLTQQFLALKNTNAISEHFEDYVLEKAKNYVELLQQRTKVLASEFAEQKMHSFRSAGLCETFVNRASAAVLKNLQTDPEKIIAEVELDILLKIAAEKLPLAHRQDFYHLAKNNVQKDINWMRAKKRKHWSEKINTALVTLYDAKLDQYLDKIIQLDRRKIDPAFGPDSQYEYEFKRLAKELIMKNEKWYQDENLTTWKETVNEAKKIVALKKDIIPLLLSERLRFAAQAEINEKDGIKDLRVEFNDAIASLMDCNRLPVLEKRCESIKQLLVMKRDVEKTRFSFFTNIEKIITTINKINGWIVNAALGKPKIRYDQSQLSVPSQEKAHGSVITRGRATK